MASKGGSSTTTQGALGTTNEVQYVQVSGITDQNGYFTVKYQFMETHAMSLGVSVADFQSAIRQAFTFAGDTRTPTRRNNFTYTSELQGSLWGRAYATVGVGMENNAIFGVAATPRVSLAYYLLKPHTQGAWSGTKLKFNYGQGIKEPSIFEETSSLFGLLSQLPNGPDLISQFHVKPIGAVRSRSFDAAACCEISASVCASATAWCASTLRCATGSAAR